MDFFSGLLLEFPRRDLLVIKQLPSLEHIRRRPLGLSFDRPPGGRVNPIDVPQRPVHVGSMSRPTHRPGGVHASWIIRGRGHVIEKWPGLQ